ncbi:alpha-glucuronidase [Salinimonas sp. HHU 13199]|uniref:Xylan alpha-1,2-glucuronidase n=1 Tax=Salinimonas profundi TaxID=2729140 RepID=A0ABR8LJN7_9ALTE|nr:alpha-glucuronidase family glycosyl hydrolase [Salinimonas profundi]MBD3586413.1 alpha-glucuronidase [Salinimonas profundi]
MKYIFLIGLLLITYGAAGASIVDGEDGYRLWLKYDPINDDDLKATYAKQVSSFYLSGDSDTMKVIGEELIFALNGMLAQAKQVNASQAGLIVAAGDKASALAARHKLDLKAAGDEGYLVYQVKHGNAEKVMILANTEVGALYGTYRLLRQLQTRQPLADMAIVSQPDIQLRVLNHWDNLDRHVERGYAGESIWDWHKLPDYRYQRYVDYARANASIGINGTVLNNVNADPLILTDHYLEKVKALADMFRPYGIKVYLSVKFSSPQLIGGLDTSDPLDEDVQQWWQAKVDDIYKHIPDFGGFLVKANSEGQPGPGDFGRTHAEGANMLASALAPHGGTVMWRAFVYANEKNEERSKQAYSEFKPLDGKFDDNVLVQVKNGPIDFQPREPFSPLFGATPETPLMMEFQITMEYLGFSTHFVYLGPMYEEVLSADTYARGEGSTVAKVIDGSLFDNNISGMAGVANIGSDRNWTGHIILQSNWYVFGRMAWNPEISAEQVADEWVRMTLSNDNEVVATVTDMMMKSHEITVNTMTPLGLHHIMGAGHHYGPAPWVDSLGRADWNSVYYHRADDEGIGFDRSPSGVNAVEQYFSPLKEQLADPATTPEKYLLWFHHLPWDYQIKSSGRTLWNELVHRYYKGADDVKALEQQWDSLKGEIDPLQFHQVQMAMDIHVKEALWWRNACVLYFQQFSDMPIPDGLPKPEKSLKQYQKMSFPHAPGQG